MPVPTSISRFSSRLFVRMALMAIALLVPSLLSAQGYFGTVSGTLTDLTGAVIPGSKVALTDAQRGYVFATKSDSDGRYLFRSIPPGVYSVSAEAEGFERARSVAFKVDVNQNATANLTLKVAGAAQTVTVEASSQTIQTEDAETGQVVNRRFINDLPLIDRDLTQLTYLAPGIVDMSDGNHASDTGGTNFVSNGSRGASADILLDGASTTNAEPNGGITAGTYTPSPEAVEEFKVEQSNFSAEYGFSGASVVNIVTRSGTNTFHGSLYDFNRDQIFDANDWFNNHQNPVIPIPPLRRNDYGLTIGGPIRKNKTFFFFDYEGFRSAGLQTAHFGVPSQAMRNGDFGEICPANGGAWDQTVGDPNYGQCVMAGDNTTLNPSGQLWDPYSGVFDSNQNGAVRSSVIPFNNIAQYISPGCNALSLPAGNSCPPNEPAAGVKGNLIDPVAQKMMSSFPMPTTPGNIYLNWFGSGATKGNDDRFDLKIDHRFNQKNMMSGKYSQEWSSGAGLNCYKNFTDPCGGGPNKTGAKLFAINDTHAFSPTLLVNAILGFTRGWWNILAYNPQGVSDPLGTLGFPSYLYSNNFKGVPAIYISQYSANGGRNIGTDPYGNYKLGQDTGQLTIAVDKVQGPHELKFGFEGRIHQMNYIQTNAPVGFFSFDFNGSSQCPNNIASCGGDGMASFLMGQLTQDCVGNEGCGSYYEIQFRPATNNYQYAGYAQDNWKLNRKLTLNLGLRYDVTLPRTERFNRQNSFDLNAASPLNNGSITYNDAVTGAPVTIPLTGGEVFATSSHRTIYVTDWSNIQPRFGLAFQFAPKMVLRGGYGIYYVQSRSGVSGVVPYGSQGFNQFTQVIPTFQNQGNVPWLTLSNPFPNGLIQPAGSSLGLLNDVGFGGNGPIETSAYNRTPYEQSWTLGMERELPGKVLINVEYLGKKGTHLPFSGTTQHDLLGPGVESLPVGDPNAANPCQALTVACLNNFVTNPFSSLNGGPISDPNSTLSSQTVQYFQLLLPHPQFTSVTSDVQLISSSIYHALQLSAEKRYSNGLQFLVTYTWSKSIDDSSVADDNVTWTGNTFSSLQDPNKPWLERGLSIFDIPHVLQASYSYDLPFGRGRSLLGNMPRVLDAIVGGWKTNGIWRMTSGRPLQMTLADGQSLPTYNAQRPDIVGTPRRSYAHDWVDNNYFVDVTVFQKPAPFVLGDAPRTLGSVRTPLWFSADLSLSKQFSLARVREAMNFEFRIEAQNAFNHPVFGTPDTSVDDGTTGLVSYTASTPRQVQLALKFNF